jgi:NAD(P)-dependent dehydrogenase (short-subunit alcohol dehydrogenase family)
MRLLNKVAVVTGAQQGIGAAIVEAYAREGANVVLNWLDDESGATEVATRARAHGVSVEMIRGDVSKSSDIEAMLDLAQTLGGLDIMVNNAAIYPRVALLDMRESDFDGLMSVNLRGTFLGMQRAAQRMVAGNKPGIIINLSSRAAVAGAVSGGVHYVASKTGVQGLTRAGALELAPHGIRVNTIAPGLADTAQPRYGMSEEEIEQAGRLTPLGRIAQPEDVANMAIFLASNEASHVTGQTLHVNGGQVLT